MAIITTGSFLEILQKSNLLDAEQFAKARDASQQSDTAKTLAKTLVHQELLTRWQAGQLLAGRTSFFLGKYKLIDLLGRGGMGSVFFAQHTTMNRPVALKIISRQLGQDPASLERFFTEARAVAALDHPNIVHAYNFDNEGQRYYIVMEFVEGQDLQRMVEAEGPLSYEKAADYIRQAAEGLAHAHSRNMVHCDVKPANLLVNRQGVVKILDMGMARLLGRPKAGNTEQDERLLGTVDYLAPEQALESPQLDHRVDIYSLGCTFYFLLTGHPPFPEGTLHERILKHQTHQPRSIVEQRPDAPKDLATICRKMMAKNAADRFQTADEVAQLLADWQPPKRKLLRAVPLAEPETPPEHEQHALDIRVEGGFSRSRASRAGGFAAGCKRAVRQHPRWALFCGLAAALGLAVLVGVVAVLASRGRQPASDQTASGTAARRDAKTAQRSPPSGPSEHQQDEWPDVKLPPSDFDPEKLTVLSDTSHKAGQRKQPNGTTGVTPVPRAEKPKAKKPAPDKPSPDKSQLDKPEPEKPSPQESKSDKSEPLQKQPATDKPAPDKPLPEKPKPDKQTPEQSKTEKPTPNQSSADKPAPEKPADGAQPVEKPKPKQPKEKDPFRELAQLVDLPELGSSADWQSPVMLGKVLAAPDVDWQLSLLGGQDALKSSRQMARKFVLQQTEPDSAKASWLIQLEESISDSEPKTTSVAKIWRDDDALMFQWAENADPASANYLRNCILQVRVEEKSRYLLLLSPKPVEPIPIDLVRGTTSGTVSLDRLPESDKLRIEITKLEAAEGYKLEPEEPAPPKTQVKLAFDRTDRHNNTRGAAEFRIMFTTRASGLSYKLQLLEPPSLQFRSLHSQNLAAVENMILAKQEQLTKELNPKDKTKAPKGEYRARLNYQLDMCEKQLWYVEFYKQVHQKAKLHFRVFVEVDGQQIVLATTEP